MITKLSGEAEADAIENARCNEEIKPYVYVSKRDYIDGFSLFPEAGEL